MLKKIKVISRRSIQEQTKEKHLLKKLSYNRLKDTARKDNASEQTKKVIILGDSIVKNVRGYDLSHSLENWKVHVKFTNI